MPFGFHLAMDTLPSRDCKWWLQVRLGCIRLSPSCPFRLLHTFHFSGQRGCQPRLWIRRSSSERRRDFNPPEQRAAQRTPWFYPRLVAYSYFWLSEGITCNGQVAQLPSTQAGGSPRGPPLSLFVVRRHIGKAHRRLGLAQIPNSVRPFGA